MKADLLSLISPAGQFKPKGSGELAGPCPLCGGTDRCCAWPERGRWWCRQCGKGGDAVDLLRLRDGLSYRAACDALGIASAPKGGKPSSFARQQGAAFGVGHKGNTEATKQKCCPLLPAAASPACDRLPSPTWQEQALIFLERARQSLGRPEALQELKRRGLTLQEAQALGLGWSLGEWHERTAWGLPEGKRMRLARGLVVPVWRGGKLLRLKIRRADETEAAQFGKWQAVAGGGNGPLVVGKAGAPVVVLEAEIDALAVFVGLGGACVAVGLGSAANRPTVESEPWLRSASHILVALDRDEAGAKAAAWWLASYRAALRWGAAGAKSPADMPRDSLRLWYAAGLQAQADTAKLSSSCRADLPTLPAVTPCQWPTLRELTEQHHATPFMVAGDDALLLEFAAGMFRSEKQAAVRFAEEHLAALAKDLLLPSVPSGVRIATRAEIAKAGPFFEPEAALESTKRKKAALHIGRMKNAA